jgi:hypothetical protein
LSKKKRGGNGSADDVLVLILATAKSFGAIIAINAFLLLKYEPALR